MKKLRNLILVCVALNALSVLILGGWCAYRSAQGDTIEAYYRFYGVKNGKAYFNYWALVFPFQVEAQRVEMKSEKHFTFTIPYPCAHHFLLIPPTDSVAEKVVAKQIADAIADSVAVIKKEYGMDWDGTSAEVRDAMYPKTVTAPEPSIVINYLEGTASPECAKCGLEQSIVPGAFEPENDTLARQRVERTRNELGKLGFKTDSISWKEVQFADTATALRALSEPALLDSMRYVTVDVTAMTHAVSVQTETAPGFLFFWLALLLLLVMGITILMHSKSETGQLDAKFLWRTAGLVGVAVIIAVLIDFFSDLLWYILIAGLLYLLYFFGIFRNIKKWYRLIQKGFCVCWSVLARCWKRVFIILCIYAIVTTVIMIYRW